MNLARNAHRGLPWRRQAWVLAVVYGVVLASCTSSEPPGLHSLVEDGRIDDLRTALENGADVNVGSKAVKCQTRCPHGDEFSSGAERTPLHVAVQCARPDAVRVLLASGASVAARDAGGRTALHYASRAAWGAKDLIESYYGLSSACRESAREASDDPGVYPGIIDLLVRAGAEVDAIDGTGGAPLHYAATEVTGHAEAEALVGHGVSLTLRDVTGRTPGDIALELGVNPAMVQLLKGTEEYGPDQATADLLRATVSNFKKRPANEETIRGLLDIGARVDAVDENGCTALHHVACDAGGDTPVVALLIAHGASVDVRDDNGATALHHAAEHSRGDIVELLIAHGASVTARDDTGWTPLHYAADAHNEGAVKVLLAHGADVDARTSGGDTPMSLARARHLFDFEDTTVEILAEAARAVATDEAGSSPAQ